MERIVRIYTLSDPRDNQIRYVGKTVKKLKDRFMDHLSESERGIKTYKCNWVRKLLKEDVIPEINLLDEVIEEDWVFWETYWISQMKEWGFRLTNQTNGGEGTHGYKLSKEQRKKMSVHRKGKSIPWLNNGKPRTEEHIKNLSESCKGRISEKKGKTYEELYGKEKADTLKKKLTDTHTGVFSGSSHPRFNKHHTQETKDKLSLRFSIPVVQLDLEDNYINEYPSIKIAGETVGIKSGICLCCKGKQRQAGGFKWKYKKDFDNEN